MRLKSAYKNIPSEPPPPASEKISVELSDKANPETTVAIEPPPPADEATVALMRAVGILAPKRRASKAVCPPSARRPGAAAAAQDPRRVSAIPGADRAEARFFDSREDMMANQQQASEAAAEALAAGIERDSPEFFEAVEEGFAKRLDALNQPAAEQPTPAPAFAPGRRRRQQQHRRTGALYSAPVSRGAIGGTGQRPARRSG